MEPRFYLRKLSIIVIVSSFCFPNDARLFPEQISEKPKVLESIEPVEPTNGKPYGLPSTFSMPPLGSLAPIPQPVESPSCAISPPQPSILPPFPPSPSVPFKCPPAGPPKSIPIPSPPKLIPSPPVHQPPPRIQPPAITPPPPHKRPQFAVWCVAKPTVPDSVIQEALDYACGSGADCQSILPNGPCFQPDTLVAHASYAFNSYWQNRKGAGGTCDFGGTAMLVTIDPSFNDCYFIVK